MFASLTLIALAVEAAVGYPKRLYEAIGHPVGWIGRLLAWCDERWNKPERTFSQRRWAGIVTIALAVFVATAASLAFAAVLTAVLPHAAALLLTAVAASTLIAQRSLDEHVRAVAGALENGTLEDARYAVAQIVGRETSTLNSHGVSRAAIESLSENFSDGVVAPIFWMLALGLPGAAAYKAINTADSMIGHKSARYLAFGWAAARLDDLVNYPAARLSALWIAAAAAAQPGANPRAALSAATKHAGNHRSPNAGWPEAAMAGALGLRLSGPRVYGGEENSDPWIGDGSAEATAHDIRRALAVYRTACVAQAAVIALLAVATFIA